MEELQFLRGDEGDGAIGAHGLWEDVLSEFCGVSLESFTLRASASFGGTRTHNAGVDAAGDAVLLLDVDLGQMEVLGVLVCKVVFHVSPGRTVEHVPHLESLDRLVLADKASAVSTADSLGAALVILRSTVVTSLRWHIFINNQSSCFNHFNAPQTTR